MKKKKLYTALRNWLIPGPVNLLVVLCLLLTGCLRELSPDNPCDTAEDEVPIQVIIHWDDKPLNILPDQMRIYWYPQSGDMLASSMERNGGMERLPQKIYTAACFDYYVNSKLDFRTGSNAQEFEVYNIQATGLYNKYADPVPGEQTVAEANPYIFYVDARPQIVDKKDVPPGDMLKLHFYPENVLREFTFLIYGVEGAKNIASNSGAISGMSASYFPASGMMANKPSTILFERVTPIIDGQRHPWSNEQKELFERLEPGWDDPDSQQYWSGDWITGKFCTFGPVDAGNLNIRLTVEAISKNKYYYYAAWGYWFGKWEDTVGIQVKGSVEGNGSGTWEERRDWWRQQNGGYDIILYNDGRLVVSDDGGGVIPDPGDGGFDVGTGPWVNVPVPLN